MSTSDTVTIPFIVYGDKAGPASYATGGFELDLTASLSFVRFLSLEIETIGSLASDEYEVILNQDTSGVFAPGKATIKLLRDRYDKFSIGNVSGNPASTTVQASKTATGTTTGSGHTHTINHDHPDTASSVSTPSGAAVNATAGATTSMVNHTHTVNLANFTGSSASETHTHDRSFEYEHAHSVGTVTDTAVALTEVANSTNLSTTTWRYYAVGD